MQTHVRDGVAIVPECVGTSITKGRSCEEQARPAMKGGTVWGPPRLLMFSRRPSPILRTLKHRGARESTSSTTRFGLNVRPNSTSASNLNSPSNAHLVQTDLRMNSQENRCMPTVLIANRGEIAVRVARAARELGLRSVAIADTFNSTQNNSASLDGNAGTNVVGEESHAMHALAADLVVPVDAYTDISSIVAAAKHTGATLIHPGYGFLSERPEFAAEVAAAGITFVGPSAATLAALGDKVQARQMARECEVPVIAGSTGIVQEACQVQGLIEGGDVRLPIVLKDPWGGGGRGIVRVDKIEDIEEALAKVLESAKESLHNSKSSTIKSRSDGGGVLGVLVEECWTGCQHIEVQILGDGHKVVDLGDRDCSLQTTRRQKILEIAPAWTVPDSLRKRIASDAKRLAAHVAYKGAATVEFLVKGNEYVFLEVNPRIQVEHTISEEVTGIDIVQTQLRIALGETLDDIGLGNQANIHVQGFALQGRVCLDTQAKNPTWNLGALKEPSGPGVRVDSCLQESVAPSLRFDPLVSKIICRASSWQTAVARFQRAMDDFATQNLTTNASLLRAIAADPTFVSGIGITTTFVPDNEKSLRASAARYPDRFFQDASPQLTRHREFGSSTDKANSESNSGNLSSSVGQPSPPAGLKVIKVLFPASVTQLHVEAGSELMEDDPICTVTAMKMDTIIRAPTSGIVEQLFVRKGTLLNDTGAQIAWMKPLSSDSKSNTDFDQAQGIPSKSRKSSVEKEKEAELASANALCEEITRERNAAAAMGGPKNVDKHHDRGRLTIRERISGMLDKNSFREMGRAAAGNFVLGTGKVASRPVVVGGEDFTISGGSPTFAGLRKSVYIETLALQLRVPLIRLHEGGGGSVAGAGGKSTSDGKPKPSGDPVFNRPRFESVSQVLATVPVACAALGPVAGLPASRLVASHFSVMTENAQVLIAGPQVVQRALGYETTKEKLGGHQVHLKSGVVDNLAADEHDAFAQIAQFLSYLPCSIDKAPPVLDEEDPIERQDKELLTAVSPLHRRQVYDMRKDILERVMDSGSIFEMTSEFGPGIITALARLGGKPVGLIANDCRFHGGAMTADGARKTKRFMETCEQFSLPIIFFVDEPGFMIGEEAESQATIRAGTEAVLKGASLSVPSASVVVRKAYGVAGAAHFGPEGRTFLWPTAEVGALPVESGVAVAFKRELDSIESEEQREARRKELEDQFSTRLSPLPRAAGFAAHDIITPPETRPILGDWLELAWPLVERHVEAKKIRSLVSQL